MNNRSQKDIQASVMRIQLKGIEMMNQVNLQHNQDYSNSFNEKRPRNKVSNNNTNRLRFLIEDQESNNTIALSNAFNYDHLQSYQQEKSTKGLSKFGLGGSQRTSFIDKTQSSQSPMLDPSVKIFGVAKNSDQNRLMNKRNSDMSEIQQQYGESAKFYQTL